MFLCCRAQGVLWDTMKTNPHVPIGGGARCALPVLSLLAIVTVGPSGSVFAEEAGGVVAATKISLESPVRQLSISVPGTVTISDKGDAGVMEMTAAPGTLEHIKVIQNKGAVTIEWISDQETDGKVAIRFSSPVLSQLAVAGSAEISCDSLVADRKGRAGVNVAGSSHVTVKSMDVKHAKVTIAGSGVVAVESGTAQTLNIGISGSGLMDGRALKATSVEAGVSGSGKAKVFALNAMKAGVSGSGSIEIYGTPASVSKSVSGSGQITEK